MRAYNLGSVCTWFMFIGALVATSSFASDFPKVDADIKIADEYVNALNSKFSLIPANPNETGWVRAKLQHMVDVDQYIRKYSRVIYDHSYSPAERAEFWKQFLPRSDAMDERNTSDVKDLLKIYSWFTISTFGTAADNNAWLLVQHADQDPQFQTSVLSILDRIWKVGETRSSNYAYLFDRVAASWRDASKRRPQRYGTQGACTGPGTWEPLPGEDPAHLDDRRASVGLGPESEYIKMFKDICHDAGS